MKAPIPVLARGERENAPNIEHLMLWADQTVVLCGEPFAALFAPKMTRGSRDCEECQRRLRLLEGR